MYSDHKLGMMPTDANTASNFLENKLVNVFTEQVTLFSQ